MRDDAAKVRALNVGAPGSAWLLRHERSYPGRPDQLRQVRTFLRKALKGHPRADDAVALGSEFAANSILHSRSGRPGGLFTVRAEVSEGDYIGVEVEDDGGPWTARACRPQSGHGLDLALALAGPGNWGIAGDAAGRRAWARLPWPGTDRLARALDPSRDDEGQAELAKLTGALDPPEAAVAAPAGDDEGQAELARLAAELTASGWHARLITPRNGPPHLDLDDDGAPDPPERIYAQSDWYFWPTAERIASCDDVATAARAITRVLRPGQASGA